MKSVLLMIVSLVASQAMASSPHDRVCVGEYKTQYGTEAINLQWRFERTYDYGDPSKDNHLVTVRGRSCVSSYEDTCMVGKQAQILPAGADENMPLSLWDANKGKLFEGNFDLNNEILSGTFKDQADVVINLTCVSQPADF